MAGSAAVMGVGAWAAEPDKKLAATEAKTVEPREAKAAHAGRYQAQQWQHAKVVGWEKRHARLERARKAAAERARERREAAEARREAAAERADRAERAAPAPSGSPQEIAQSMLDDYGWSSSEFGCLQSLWEQESSWDPQASNPSSGAYGIPQALPGSKMASAGGDWQTNPATQIEWGLGYIQDRYGSPCAAWEHSQANGYY
ncbi:MAG: transglycosylase SLT domain-containing protein [Actinomycetes bacterium]